jgi:hypothetical protein
MYEQVNQYRVTKYDPKNRVNGVYTKDEWISMYDVSKTYDGKLFTFAEYLKVEESYLNVIDIVMNELNVGNVKVKDGERIFAVLNNSTLDSREEVLMITRSVLREDFWCKLEAENFFVHFGYDFYMYIGADIDDEKMRKIAEENGLFAERINESPYLRIPEED